MAIDYPITQIGEVAASISDTHKFGKERLIFLNTSDILHGKFLHRNYSAIKNWPGQAKKSIRKDDILFSEIRPANGRWAYVDQDASDFVVSTKLMVIRAKQDRLFPKFLYQFLTSAETTKWLQHLAESRSGTFPQITFEQVATLTLPIPPIAEQKAIAAVLGALDDKIDLNQRMNAMLEKTARALFQSWFVDFDPIHAKLDGRRPAGLDPITATLFPDCFHRSTLGPIPHGWRAARLEEIASVGSGKRPNGRCDVKSPGCNVPLYGGGGLMGYVPSVAYDKPILFTGRVGTLGIIFRTAEPSWPSDNTLIIEPQPGLFDFTYFILKGFDLVTLNRGSTQPLLTQTDLKQQTFTLPTEDIIKRFSDISEPIFRQIVCNEKESRALATLRDTLKPKLLSGELRVKGLEQVDSNEIHISQKPVVGKTTSRTGCNDLDRSEHRLEKRDPLLASFKQVASSDSATPGITEIETNDVMAAFRQALRGRGTMTREELMKFVSRRLGFQRLGPNLREHLKGHMRAAIRRKIVGTQGPEDAYAQTSTIADYSRDELIDTLCSVIPKNYSLTRAEAITAVAHHLGFRRVNETLTNEIKSAINGAIRRNVLAYEGELIWRIT